MILYVLICPYSCRVRSHVSLAAVSTEAIRLHRKYRGLPRFQLWRCDGSKDEFVGTLWKEPGAEFNPADCWRIEDLGITKGRC